MRTETITRTIYKFGELDASTQKKVLDRLRDINTDHDWWDANYCDADEVAKAMGIDIDRRTIRKRDGTTAEGGPEIQFSGFASQGDGASFTGSYSHKPDAPQAVREHAPKDETLHGIADDLEALQVRAGGGLIATITRDRGGNYVHERTVTTNLQDEEDGRWTLELEKELGEIMVRFMRWIYKQLEETYFYLQSDEAVRETIEANEYEYLENGDDA